MEEAIRTALEYDLVIDITTTGRKTGRPHRKEIWFHNVDGQLYITGSPGRGIGMPTCWPIRSSPST